MILNVCCSPTQKLQPNGKGELMNSCPHSVTCGSSASILSDLGVKVPSSGSKSCLGQPTENAHGLGDRWPRRRTSDFLRNNPDLIPQGISVSSQQSHQENSPTLRNSIIALIQATKKNSCFGSEQRDGRTACHTGRARLLSDPNYRERYSTRGLPRTCIIQV